MLQAVKLGADAVEFRLDYLDRPSDVRALQELFSSKPVEAIATCRPARQGGHYHGDESQRLAILAKAAELGGIEAEPRVIELRPTPSALDLFYGLQSRSTMPTLEEILGWAGVPSLQFRFVRP